MNLEEIVFSIIISAGNARARAYDALASAQEGDFEKAKEYIREAEKEVGDAHKVQTEIIQREAKGDKVELSLLFVHAQDHLMTAISEKGLIENMIKLYKRINILENR